MQLLRTWLFAPGNSERRIAKVLGLEVDAIILDLEDACAIAEKEISRAFIVEALNKPRRSAGYVRVNALSTPFAFDDLAAVVTKGTDGIVLPKAETVSDILTADWTIGQLERKAGLEQGSVDLVPLIEVATGLANVGEIARSCARVKRLAFGGGDLTLDLSMLWSDDERELHPYRAALVLASRAAGIEPPIDGPWIRIGDAAGLARSSDRARGDGFGGKLCIHPDQIRTVNAAFEPSIEQIERAQRLVDAFAEAERTGRAAVQLDGVMIDYPIADQARRILASVRNPRTRG
jgi:citrate lyase subunit beta / citryl-CoA lyase